MNRSPRIGRIRRCGDGLAVLAAVAVAAMSTAGPSLASLGSAPGSHPGKPTTTVSQRNGNPGKPGGDNGRPATTPTPGHGAETSGSAQGIVQSVAGGTVVLTQLDGSSLSLSVTTGTRVFVDGSRAAVREVKPGFVASAAWVAGKTRVLQTFDLSSPGAVEVGSVRSVSGRNILVRLSDGSTVRIRVGARTEVLLDGSAATLRAVKAGYTVVFAARDTKPGKAAGELRFLRPV